MSSGGDVGVLCKEESARMPAWKRELLERRKAKGGEVTARSGSKSEDEATGTETRHHGASPATSPVKTKEPRSSSPSPSPSHTNGRATETDDDDGGGGLPESLVLRESLGPLQENPFIKLEKERKKRRERENAARPLQHVLELYGSVPGIRTIRAENIIIIESDPDYFPEGAGLKHGAKPQQNGTVSGYSSLNDLLDRRGSPVTEIRAREVVVYDTALSRSEENLSTLGRPDGDLADLTEGQGRVSRMLQKFDRNYGKLQGKSRSSENLLDLDTGPSRFSPRPKAQPDVVPKYAASPQPSSPVCVSQSQVVAEPVFQNSQSSKTKLHDSPGEPASSTPVSGSPQLVSSFRRRFEASGGRSVTVNSREEAERSQAKPVRERDWDGTDGASKAKVPCSPESHHAHAESSPSPAAITEPITSPSFEIRPSPRPDLSSLPASDLQARALANLRLQSRNSFTVIPKRHGAAPVPSNSVQSLAPSRPVKSLAPSSPVQSLAPSSPVMSLAPSSPVMSLAPSSPVLSVAPSSPVLSVAPSSPVLSPVPTVPTPASPTPLPAALSTEKLAKTPSPLSSAKTELPQPASPRLSLTTLSHDSTTPSPGSPTKSVSPPAPQEAQAPDRLPITNIDDVVVEPLPPFPSPMVQRRKGNTFTVVPKRRSEPQLASTETQEPASTPQGSPSTPQAPYAQLGTLLKKRYPAVEEIEVIGGYLSLGRSCLSKTGSTGKKLKISFNESSLQSTFEYPSECSAWDSGEEEEEGGRGGDGGGEEDGGISMERIHIPRPTYTSSPTNHTPNSTDLSNYTPKHSVEFTAWQEHKLDDPAHLGDGSSQQTNMSEEVMLTPADSSSLSDFSSEPALYF
ncbi:taperin [Colossoma macropomum]|uniref:taperin n=1 Tax=Colossoma macropomum TaxID=42526 RepID=UPI001863AF32|nr:taperin [Colossoma macropomum]